MGHISRAPKKHFRLRHQGLPRFLMIQKVHHLCEAGLTFGSHRQIVAKVSSYRCDSVVVNFDVLCDGSETGDCFLGIPINSIFTSSTLFDELLASTVSSVLTLAVSAIEVCKQHSTHSYHFLVSIFLTTLFICFNFSPRSRIASFICSCKQMFSS